MTYTRRKTVLAAFSVLFVCGGIAACGNKSGNDSKPQLGEGAGREFVVLVLGQVGPLPVDQVDQRDRRIARIRQQSLDLRIIALRRRQQGRQTPHHVLHHLIHPDGLGHDATDFGKKRMGAVGPVELPTSLVGHKQQPRLRQAVQFRPHRIGGLSELVGESLVEEVSIDGMCGVY